jgi:hypothetical protein
LDEAHRQCDGGIAAQVGMQFTFTSMNITPTVFSAQVQLPSSPRFAPWAQTSLAASKESGEEVQAFISSYVILAGKYKQTRQQERANK